MPASVPGCPFRKVGLANGPPVCLLQDEFIDMMPCLFTSFLGLPPFCLRKDPLTPTFGGGIGILAVKRAWQKNTESGIG